MGAYTIERKKKGFPIYEETGSIVCPLIRSAYVFYRAPSNCKQTKKKTNQLIAVLSNGNEPLLYAPTL